MSGPRRRLLLVGLLAVAVAGLGRTAPAEGRTVSTGARGSAGVEVQVNGSPARNALADLGVPDVIETDTLCPAIGAQPGASSIFGWSMARVLTAAGVPVGQASSVTVSLQLGGTPHTVALLPADFDPTVPSDYYEPGAVAAIELVSGDTYKFFRPVREQPCEDANAPLDGNPTSPLVIDITTGARLLDVTAAATPARTAVGSPVRLTSTVDGIRPGVVLTTTWSVDDGSAEVTGATVSHTFTRAGTFTAVASVAGSDRSGGVSPPVSITVGSAPGTPGNGASMTTRPPQGVATTGPTSGAVVPGASAQSGAGAAAVGASTALSPSPRTTGSGATPTPTDGRAVVSGLLLAGAGVHPGGVHAPLQATGPHGAGTSTFHLTTGESVGGLTAALLLVGGVVELQLGGDGAATVRRTRRSQATKGRHAP